MKKSGAKTAAGTIKFSDLGYARISVGEAVREIDAAEAELDAAGSAEDAAAAYLKLDGFFDRVSDCAGIANIRHTLNTEDKFYLKEREYWDSATPVILARGIGFIVKFLASPFRGEMEKILPKKLFSDMEIRVNTVKPEIVEDMTEENALMTEYGRLMSSVTVRWRGEDVPHTLFKKYFLDDDRATRREAFNAFGAAMEKIAGRLDDIFARLVRVRHRQAKKLGLKNYIELGYLKMTRNCFDENAVRVFRRNVLNDIVPLVTRINERTAAKIGIKGGRKLFDNSIFLASAPRIKGTPEEILNAAGRMYRALSKASGDKTIETLYKKMSAAEHFDVIARKGKRGGGYCEFLNEIKLPFIFANFNGTTADADVLTHEFGHALAFYAAADIKPSDLRNPTYETCEVHSMSMEFFAEKYMDLFFGDAAEDYNFSHLADAVNFIPYGTLVDHFQHSVYENPDMTPAERNAEYLRLEKLYRPYLSADGITYFEKGTRWQYQLHIFEKPFYYIDYALAQTAALQFCIGKDENYEKAFAVYLDFLKKGGTKTFAELVGEAGLASPFAEGGLNFIAAAVAKKLGI